MQNELKPCPFCGGEAKRKKYNGKLHRISCSICDIQTPIQEDDPVKIWNTRQPDFNWTPIRELTEDSLLGATQVLLYSKYKHSYIFIIHTNFKGEVFLIDTFADYLSFNELSEDYTDYALLTPPKS